MAVADNSRVAVAVDSRRAAVLVVDSRVVADSLVPTHPLRRTRIIHSPHSTAVDRTAAQSNTAAVRSFYTSVTI
jgi:hypothetical protein